MRWPWWVAFGCFVMAVLSFVVFRAGALADWLTVATAVFAVVGVLRDRLDIERSGPTN